MLLKGLLVAFRNSAVILNNVVVFITKFTRAVRHPRIVFHAFSYYAQLLKRWRGLTICFLHSTIYCSPCEVHAINGKRTSTDGGCYDVRSATCFGESDEKWADLSRLNHESTQTATILTRLRNVIYRQKKWKFHSTFSLKKKLIICVRSRSPDQWWRIGRSRDPCLARPTRAFCTCTRSRDIRCPCKILCGTHSRAQFPGNLKARNAIALKNWSRVGKPPGVNFPKFRSLRRVVSPVIVLFFYQVARSNVTISRSPQRSVKFC